MSSDLLRARIRIMPLADKVMLVLMALTVLLGVGRFLYVVATLPYERLAAIEVADPVESLAAYDETQTVAGVLNDDRDFMSWWRRLVPKQAGGDYLKAMTQRSSRRTVGAVLGTVIERQKDAGVVIVRVIVPKDNDALVGGEAATFFERADGTEISGDWAPVSKAAKRFTKTNIDSIDYHPVLTDKQTAALESSIGLTWLTEDFRIGGPVAGGSGEWILYAHAQNPFTPEGDHEYLLIPVEADPKGVATW